MDKGIDYLLTLRKKYEEEIRADVFMISSCAYDDIKNKYFEQMNQRKEIKSKICNLIDRWNQSHHKINLSNILEIDGRDILCQRLRDIIYEIEICSITLLCGRMVLIGVSSITSVFSHRLHQSDDPISKEGNLLSKEITDCVDKIF